MVGGLRPMNSKQLPPTCEEALTTLRALLAQCSYSDLDISNKQDVRMLLARRQAEASLQKLEIELGFRKPPARKKSAVKRKRK